MLFGIELNSFNTTWLVILSLLGSAWLAMTAAVFYKYVEAVVAVLIRRQGEPDFVSGPEPAYKNYFFGKAWTDYGSIVSRSSKANWDMLEKVAKFSNLATDSYFFFVGHLILIGAANGVLASNANNASREPTCFSGSRVTRVEGCDMPSLCHDATSHAATSGGSAESTPSTDASTTSYPSGRSTSTSRSSGSATTRRTAC